MSNTHGNDGVVKIGANSVAEVTRWNLRTGIQQAEANAMGDTWEEHKTGLKSWDGSVDCWWDPSDTNGQEAMTIGASVTLGLYPQGDASADVYYSGTATITEIARSAEQAGIVSASFSFRGTGALTQSTVV